jgi:hypothetical protein
MNKKTKAHLDTLLEHIQSAIQEIHTILTPLTDEELIVKWTPLLSYAKIPEENIVDCVYELEAIERNFYSTFIRASMFKKITDIYSTVPPKGNLEC